jgi:hypothetical protein
MINLPGLRNGSTEAEARDKHAEHLCSLIHFKLECRPILHDPTWDMLQFLSSSDSLSNEQIEFGHRLDAIAIGTTTVSQTFGPASVPSTES